MALISENRKFLQLFSLVSSIITLFIARELIRSDTFLNTKGGKAFAMLIVCFLPQFVIYSLQISNDSLAVMLGFGALYKTDQLLTRPGTKSFMELVIVLSCGLLTKGQFLVISVILFPFACLCYWRQAQVRSKTTFVYFAAFLLMITGCIKYIQNAAQYQRPLVSNLDFSPDWLTSNQGTYKGVISIVDVNIVKLLQEPTFSNSMRHSIPLLLYASFWYHYMDDSNLRGNLSDKAKNIGRYLHFVGIFPTLIMCIGVVSVCRLPFQCESPEFVSPMTLRLLAAGAFVANLGMLLWIFSRFDAWSILQARSLFPTLVGGAVFYDAGIQYVECKLDIKKLYGIWHGAFLAGVLGYFMVESLLQADTWLRR